MASSKAIEFTRKELAMARLMAKGKGTPEMSLELHITQKEVRHIGARLARKVGKTDRAAIVAFMIRHDYIE